MVERVYNLKHEREIGYNRRAYEKRKRTRAEEERPHESQMEIDFANENITPSPTDNLEIVKRRAKEIVLDAVDKLFDLLYKTNR